MSTLLKDNNPASALFNKTRLAVLSLLFRHSDQTFYLRKIVRMTGTGLGSVQRELKQLVSAGIVSRLLAGKRIYYQANLENPLFNALRDLLVVADSSIKSMDSTYVVSDFPSAKRNIKVPDVKLAEFCQRNHITRLAFFGSVLREDFNPDSDIDVLVEFESGYAPGFAIIALQDELSIIFGRKVDLRTAQDLSRYFRDNVVKEAKVLYAAKQG